MKPLKVAVIQNDAGRDVVRNLARIREVVEGIDDADVIVLPELFACKGNLPDNRGMAEVIPGPQTEFLASLARDRHAWVLGGSVVEKTEEERPRYLNTSILVDRAGKVHATYRKIHLFKANLSDGTTLSEADFYAAGETPVTAEIEGWQAGFSVCYDLRFPELYRTYADRDARILFIPSNFTRETGRAHWQTLVRARAIENQCFVVAPNQCGENSSNGVVSYGHSLVVGPWGEILAEGGYEETVLSAELDPEAVDQARGRVPAVFNRRLN